MYNDVDGNGLKTGGEPGLQGWTLELLDSSGNVLATQTSDASGNYTFTGVGPGKLSVAEVVQTNWVQTQPLYPTVYTFTGQGGHNLTALNFGDHASPALSPVQVIDNGQAGYAETGAWNTVTGGFNGTNRVAQTSHGSGATATASWTFTGLNPAFVYDVYVTFASKGNYSKAAPFTVYDGSTSLGTQFINESILVTQAQGGRTQGSLRWCRLGGAECLHLDLQRHAESRLGQQCQRQLRGRRRRAHCEPRCRQPARVIASAGLQQHQRRPVVDRHARRNPARVWHEHQEGLGQWFHHRCDHCDQRRDSGQPGERGLHPGPGAEQFDITQRG